MVQEPLFTGGTPDVTTYTYDDAGNLDTVALANGLTSDYGYDALNRLTDLVVTQGDGDKLFEQAFTLEADGQRDFVIEKRYDGASATPFSEVKIDWTYDALDHSSTQYSNIAVYNFNYRRIRRLRGEIGSLGSFCIFP